ncbi:GH20669 [Drosophila grimshawi]|uniref:GH20669 n=1 Tax=Drosophila grimshawi TaxID=7222 RepID=B4JRG4_DROGR|nr:GH20669 [Drosophila grimshawi]
MPIAIAVRPQPHLNFNMLPMSATIGLGSPTVAEANGSRAGTPTNSNKSDIPAITVTASPGPASILLSMKPTNSASDTRQTMSTPTSGSGLPMSTSGRSQCF